MKYLENKSYDSKREMELMEALEDIKNLNKRQAIIDPEDLLQNLFYKQDEEEGFDEEQEAAMDRQYDELKAKLRSEKAGGAGVKKEVIQEQPAEEDQEDQEDEEDIEGIEDSEGKLEQRQVDE